jgi:hypothetical protein
VHQDGVEQVRCKLQSVRGQHVVDLHLFGEAQDPASMLILPVPFIGEIVEGDAAVPQLREDRRLVCGAGAEVQDRPVARYPLEDGLRGPLAVRTRRGEVARERKPFAGPLRCRADH